MEWYHKHHEYARFDYGRRKAVESSILESEKPVILAIYRRNSTADVVSCYYCQKEIPKEPWQRQIDHVFPIVRGGKHEIGNLADACKHCNASKNGRLISEWYREGQQLLNL